jgi:hypothetical protein
MCHLKYIYEKRNFSDQPGSPDDRSADSLQLLLWTPKSNCAIQVLRFTPTLRHSGTEGKDDKLGISKFLSVMAGNLWGRN